MVERASDGHQLQGDFAIETRVPGPGFSERSHQCVREAEGDPSIRSSAMKLGKCGEDFELEIRDRSACCAGLG